MEFQVTKSMNWLFTLALCLCWRDWPFAWGCSMENASLSPEFVFWGSSCDQVLASEELITWGPKPRHRRFLSHELSAPWSGTQSFHGPEFRQEITLGVKRKKKYRCLVSVHIMRCMARRHYGSVLARSCVRNARDLPLWKLPRATWQAPQSFYCWGNGKASHDQHQTVHFSKRDTKTAEES